MDSVTKQEKLADFQHIIAVETARKQIKNAVLVTAFMGILVLVSQLLGMFVTNIAGYDTSRSGSGYYWILEVLFVFGMGYGISRYNLLCSRLMFGYCIVRDEMSSRTETYDKPVLNTSIPIDETVPIEGSKN